MHVSGAFRKHLSIRLDNVTPHHLEPEEFIEFLQPDKYFPTWPP